MTDALEMPRFLLGRRRIGIGSRDNSSFRLISAGEREFNRHHFRGVLVSDLFPEILRRSFLPDAVASKILWVESSLPSGINSPSTSIAHRSPRTHVPPRLPFASVRCTAKNVAPLYFASHVPANGARSPERLALLSRNEKAERPIDAAPIRQTVINLTARVFLLVSLFFRMFMIRSSKVLVSKSPNA